MPRLKGFKKLTRVDDALGLFLEELKPTRLGIDHIPINEAWQRVAAENVSAPSDLPLFERSAMDGYALIASDTFGASEFKPTLFELTEKDSVDKGEAKQIWTGGMIPKGADAVVMLEHTSKTEGGISVIVAVTPGENISKRGEDIRKSEIAVKAGTRLLPQHLGLLAGLGITHINVVRKPKVALLSTGNELVELGQKPRLGQVFNVNDTILSAICQQIGAETINLGIARDDLGKIKDRITEGVKQADAVITTGGTSVGHADLVPTAVNNLGKPGVIVHGIAMRPAMPTALAIVRGKPVFILSGYPVAAMFGFEVFVRPVILRLLGIEDENRPMLKARLTRRVASALGRRVYLRVRVFKERSEFFAEPIRTKGSGVLSTMTKANGYVVIPENRNGLEDNEAAIVYLFDKIGGK
ncbi:molybdopterin molybdenumtransferase MoeA [Candidatus Bathyarchaeota archaeon]|nr:molybdopterin molybdenumtransferase MoeA [Candidatus Bathyarchaeota archaeon]NIV43803.1 molybdopterin molybdenumtransferase MoeA [Candidatus Bathyarchaeota archaeon]